MNVLYVYLKDLKRQFIKVIAYLVKIEQIIEEYALCLHFKVHISIYYKELDVT